MKAVIYEEFGDPSQVLKLTDKDAPQPKAGEVRVRTILSPINPSDLMSIRGGYTYEPRLPATPGFEGVGIVDRYAQLRCARMVRSITPPFCSMAAW